MGQVIEPRKRLKLRVADAVVPVRKATSGASLSRDVTETRAVEDPVHVWTHLVGNREIPCLPEKVGPYREV
jgi:hypothetical protein